MAKDTYLKKVLGTERHERLKNTKVLMVGAGGIGCELIKDLLFSGFGEIHIVDLDTITLSNLNRQFLFRQKDIDKSKSLTICKAVQSFNYFGTQLVPHHGNIMNTAQFPIEWWDQFTYIFNALDNLEARRYVNKMSLFLQKPLMESGTTGYDGQIQSIFPYVSECFDCSAKVTPKTFPVCTIRSTPSQPVHCITWAKEFLFRQLFDEAELQGQQEANEKTLQNETDNKQEIENILKESNELIDIRKLITDSQEPSSFVKKMIMKIFKVDIERSLRLESLWKTRTKPVPLPFEEEYEDDLLKAVEDWENNDSKIMANDTKVWSVLENLYVLYRSSNNLQRRLTSGNESFISFDKDDEDTLNFVVSASNLRCYIFHIEVKSKFDTKQVAGNIIPAIATTNAIISGFSSLASLHYYDNKQAARSTDQILSDFSTVFISIRHNKYVTSASLLGPNKSCPSCGLASRGLLGIHEGDMSGIKLSQLIELVKEKYGFSGDISLILGSSKLIYDYDFEDFLETSLTEIPGFKNHELLLIQDEEDELENLELLITTKSGDELSESITFPELKLRAKQQSVSANEDLEDDDPQPNGSGPGASPNNNEPIVIDEEEDGDHADDMSLVHDTNQPDPEDQPSLKKRRVVPIELV